MGIPPLLGVPIAAVVLIGTVLTASYRRWERMVVALCLLDVAWLVVAWRLRPTASRLRHDTLVPTLPADGLTGNYIFLVIAIVGTTIAPWQLFFQQSCVADKRLRFSDLRWARLDTFLGACFTIAVAAAMVLVGDFALTHGIRFEDPAQMATAMVGITGEAIRRSEERRVGK